jgi:hypothetical protein
LRQELFQAQFEVEFVMKNKVLGAAFAVASLIAFSPAQAASLTGTFNFSIYHTGAGGGLITSPDQQAQASNPLASGSAIATGTYTGALNFNSAGESSNNIWDWLLTGGGLGALTNFSALEIATLQQTTKSSAPFKDTTLFVITGTTGANILDGFIVHDDGITLYDSLNNAVAASPAPTTQVATQYQNLLGPFSLYYIAANGNPSVLDFEYTNTTAAPTPLPAAVWMFGTALAGAGLLARRRKQRKLSAFKAA